MGSTLRNNISISSVVLTIDSVKFCIYGKLHLVTLKLFCPFSIEGLSGLFLLLPSYYIYEKKSSVFYENNVDPDQAPDLGLHCLPKRGV